MAHNIKDSFTQIIKDKLELSIFKTYCSTQNKKYHGSGIVMHIPFHLMPLENYARYIKREGIPIISTKKLCLFEYAVSYLQPAIAIFDPCTIGGADMSNNQLINRLHNSSPDTKLVVVEVSQRFRQIVGDTFLKIGVDYHASEPNPNLPLEKIINVMENPPTEFVEQIRPYLK